MDEELVKNGTGQGHIYGAYFATVRYKHTWTLLCLDTVVAPAVFHVI